MKRWRSTCPGMFMGCLAVFGIAFPAIVNAQVDYYSGVEQGTPAYSYYVAESIIQTYQQAYQIEDTFQKKPISMNLRPRNVYERTLAVMEEFDLLFPGVITQRQRDVAYAVNADKASPTEISGILMLIQQELARQNILVEFSGVKTAKTPNDVYQIVRKIGWFHRQIATKRHIKTTWDSVDRVYDTVVMEFLPVVYAIADARQVAYETYAFPLQPSQDVQPRNIYMLIIELYKQITAYYSASGDTIDMVEFTEINDCDEILPADVFDLEQVVIAELRLKWPDLQVSGQIASRFAAWKSIQDKLVPGHTFRLLQHLYLLMESVATHSTTNL